MDWTRVCAVCDDESVNISCICSENDYLGIGDGYHHVIAHTEKMLCKLISCYISEKQ